MVKHDFCQILKLLTKLVQDTLMSLSFPFVLQENSAIRVLYLGHNYFRELGGKQIADGLGKQKAKSVFHHENIPI